MKYRLNTSNILWLLALLFCTCNLALAQPTIQSVTGEIAQKQTIVIRGTDFSIKNPAAPLWWDDGEGATVDQGPSYMTSGELSWVTSATYSSTSKHYGAVGPDSVTEDSGASNTQYRLSTHRSLGAPHSHSTKIISGCHDDQGECLGNEVGQNVALGLGADGYRNTWYVRYYMRLDPLWPDLGEGNENYKTFNWNTDISDPGGLYENSNGFIYEVIGGNYNFYSNLGRSPKGYDNYITASGFSDGSGQQIIDSANCSGAYSFYGYPVVTYDTHVPNPVHQWVVEERLLNVSSDLFIWRVDNIDAINTENVPSCELNSRRIGNGICGVTIGGFWKGGMCNGYQDDLDDDACRAFDDIYIDNTFARVMLTNNPDYLSSTIIEPQIPSAWNIENITCTVNLGRLPDNETAYLFVFDSENIHNTVGYPVTVGDSAGDGTIVIDSPTNLRIVQ